MYFFFIKKKINFLYVPQPIISNIKIIIISPIDVHIGMHICLNIGKVDGNLSRYPEGRRKLFYFFIF